MDNKGKISILISVSSILVVAVTINQYQNKLEIEKALNQRLEEEQEYLINNIKAQDKALDKQTKALQEYKKEIQQLQKRIKQLEKPKPASRGVSTNDSDRGHILIGTFEATAYDDSVESQGKWVGQTASGMKPQVGVVAVDPNIIPLGTKLYIEGYGNCIAGDIGGAIKGYRVDLFMNTRAECYAWGRRKVKVYRRN